MYKKTLLVLGGLAASIALVGAGCATAPAGNETTAGKNTVGIETPENNVDGNDLAGANGQSMATTKLADLSVSMSYPSDWGTAGKPGSLKTAGGTAKAISFSAFQEQVGSVDVYYYSANYKPLKGSETPYPLAATTCQNLSALLQVETTNNVKSIENCDMVEANGKTMLFFNDNRVNSYVGLLYTGNATYPLLELVSNMEGSSGVNRQTFESVLRSIK